MSQTKKVRNEYEELSTASSSTYRERERANKRKNGITDNILSEKQNMQRRGEKDVCTSDVLPRRTEKR